MVTTWAGVSICVVNCDSRHGALTGRTVRTGCDYVALRDGEEAYKTLCVVVQTVALCVTASRPIRHFV